MSELQGLQSRIHDIRAAGAELVAISVDQEEDGRRVVDRLDADFPVLSDPDAAAISAYGVLHPGGGIGGADIARPATFLIDPDGVIRWRQLTENWRVRVRPQQVIEAIESTSRSD
jgi:peroxiredoxin